MILSWNLGVTLYNYGHILGEHSDSSGFVVSHWAYLLYFLNNTNHGLFNGRQFNEICVVFIETPALLTVLFEF